LVSGITQANLSTLIIVEYPISDLLIAISFTFPLIVVGILAILYQRYLPRTDRQRNLILAGGLLCMLFSAFLLLYASFGMLPGFDQTAGSYGIVMGAVQEAYWLIFSTIPMGILYLAVVSLIVASVAIKVLSPPDPDFVKLNEGLKEATEKFTKMNEDVQKLEGENKQLKEFVSEKETALSSLQEQLDTIKAEVSDREKRITEMEAAMATPTPDREPELLATIAQKDTAIADLNKKLEELQMALVEASKAAAVPVAAGPDVRAEQLEASLQESQAKLQDYLRRAETASQVSDSVISDLAELMSQVESSGLESSAKQSVTNLIKNVGRAIGRVSEVPAGEARTEPKVELIGAVMIVHEIVDGIKKMIRES
jgi:hypothetical protein